MTSDLDIRSKKRIIAQTFSTKSAYDENIPFSHLDRNENIYKSYVGGDYDLEIRPQFRYSKSISIFSDIAKNFGYKFEEFKSTGKIDGYFIFTHEDKRFPFISLSPSKLNSDHDFIIKISSPYFNTGIKDCNSPLKTNSDCFYLLYKKLHFFFKESEHEDIKRKIALLKIIQKLKK